MVNFYGSIDGINANYANMEINVKDRVLNTM